MIMGLENMVPMGYDELNILAININPSILIVCIKYGPCIINIKYYLGLMRKYSFEFWIEYFII